VLGETQTLRAGCSKARPNIFTPPQTTFSGARDGQNLISWRWSLPLPTNPVLWGSIHAISSYRGNRPTNKQTQPQTHKQTGPITIHCAAKLSAQCNNIHIRLNFVTSSFLCKVYLIRLIFAKGIDRTLLPCFYWPHRADMSYSFISLPIFSGFLCGPPP